MNKIALICSSGGHLFELLRLRECFSDQPHFWVTFLTEDGIVLRGWFIPAENCRGTIIFCAGHSGSMDSDLKYAPAFHQHGYAEGT